MRVSSSGGVPAVATTLDTTNGEDVHRWPHFLPDGRHFLYTAVTGTCCPASTPAVIRVGSLDQPGGDRAGLGDPEQLRERAEDEDPGEDQARGLGRGHASATISCSVLPVRVTFSPSSHTVSTKRESKRK